MTNRTKVGVLFCTLIIIGSIFSVGCDERNEPDLPAAVYTLSKTMVLPGDVLDVDVSGHMLAVAASQAGTYLYDISDLANPAEVFHHVPTGVFYSAWTKVDPANGLILTAMEPGAAPGLKYPIHVYATNTFIGQAAFSAGIEEIALISKENEFTAWRSDRTDGVASDSYCYDPDSARWRPEYCTSFYTGYVPINVFARGFGTRDSLFAIAMSNYEIVLHNVLSGTTGAHVTTPGDPQDCAWYGDYILVADNVFLTVVNAANLDTPTVVKTLTIPGADRLQRIVMDGNYAILLDDADGFYVVDVASPASPVLVQSFLLPEISSISATDHMIAASDEQLGVLIYQR